MFVSSRCDKNDIALTFKNINRERKVKKKKATREVMKAHG